MGKNYVDRKYGIDTRRQRFPFHFQVQGDNSTKKKESPRRQIFYQRKQRVHDKNRGRLSFKRVYFHTSP